MTRSNTIALDCDGVLLDYGRAYGSAWKRAFAEDPILLNPHSYWPMDRWGIPRLSGRKLDQFRSVFDESFWSTIPAIDGALEACHTLVRAGYALVCVTALEAHHLSARKRNLMSLGFPISDVIATDSTVSGVSPKASVLNQLRPVAFVDDYAPYLAVVSTKIHRALILRDPIGSPNVGDALAHADSMHAYLQEFVETWLQRTQSNSTDNASEWVQPKPLPLHATVRVQKLLSVLGHKRGGLGIIVHVYAGGAAYEVEILGDDGATLGVHTIAAGHLRIRCTSHEE